MRTTWDVLMQVTGWVKIGEVEIEGEEWSTAMEAANNSDDLDEWTAEPFESNLVDLLEREGSLEVEKQ